jgi:hypothetical protein
MAGVEEKFTSATQFEAVGAHVALTSCRECGAAILLDPRDIANWFDATAKHMEWHERMVTDARP